MNSKYSIINKDSSVVFFFIFLYLVSIFTFFKYRIIVELLCDFVLLIYLFTHKRIFLPKFFLVWGGAFFFVSCISILYSRVPAYTTRVTFAFLEVFVLSLLLLNYLDTLEKVITMLKLISISGVFLFVFLLFKFPFSNWFAGRLGNREINSNSIAIYMLISLFITLGLIKNTRRFHRFVYAIFIIIFTFTILATGSKKGIISIIIGGLLFVFLCERQKTKKYFFLLSIPIILYLIVFIIMQNDSLYASIGIRIDSLIYNLFGFYYRSFSYADMASDEFRFSLISRGIELWIEHPLFGNGLGVFEFISGTSVYAHNDYIEILVGVGLFGFIIYYSRYFYLLSKLYQSLKTKNVYIVSLFTILLILIINNLAMVTFAGELWFLLFVLMEKYRLFVVHNSNNISEYSRF